MQSPDPGSPAGVEAEEAFFAGVYQRLVGIMVVLGIAGTAAAWVTYNAAIALAFLVGSLIAVVNFHWLKRTIEAMGRRLPAPGKASAVWGIVIRFLLRYILIAVAAYVILKSTTNSFYGFFAGLSVPVGAILMEALYETCRTFRNLISRN
ncbi:MAG TPA: ATP synthase subunit I [Candidatus Angelobacter sp.]